MARNLPRFRSLFSPERRSARTARWSKRFRRFSLSSWQSNRIVEQVCGMFRAGALAARAVREATGSTTVGMSYGRQLAMESLEDRRVLNADYHSLATSDFSQDW